jgi:hypothetical protein
MYFNENISKKDLEYEKLVDSLFEDAKNNEFNTENEFFFDA